MNRSLRLLGYALFLVALAVAGWMYWRVGERLLWGYAPLALYASIAGGTYLLRTFRSDGTTRADNHLSALSGLLLGVGFPGFLPFPFLLLVALVPLFRLRRKLTERGAGYGEVFRHGFGAFFLYNALATYWVTNTALAAGLVAVIVNSLLMCLPWLFFYWTARRSPRVAHLGFLTAWMSFELLHYHWDLNWPWLTLGNGFAQFPALVQWYEWTGVFGGTAWIILCNYLVFRVTDGPRPTPWAKRPLLWVSVAVLLPVTVSLVRYFTYAEPAGETITVASVQPNFEPHFEKFSNDLRSQLDTFTRLSLAALAEGPVDYVLYPETSFGGIEEDRAAESRALRTLREALAGRGAPYLVSGIDAYHVFGPGEPVTPAVRYLRRREGTLALEALNGAVQLDLDSGAYQTYRKGVFVPGAESFPFKTVLFFLEGWIDQLGGTTAGRGTQAERTPLVSPVASVAPVICYESVFGEYFTDYIREGAQAIFVMTNDGWWDNTAGHRQHLWFSSLRAIETRRAVVRSANTGICAFIDQRGRIVSRTRYDEATYLRGELKLNDATTLYVRLGDLLARVALLVFAMIFLGNVARTVRPAAFSGRRDT